MKSIKVLAVVALTTLASFTSQAQSSKTIVENAIGSKDHTTLVAAVKAARDIATDYFLYGASNAPASPRFYNAVAQKMILKEYLDLLLVVMFSWVF